MLDWIDRIPLGFLIVFALFMLAAPFRPMPHVLEKLMMLKSGTLSKPLDIFDLFYHLAPTLLLIIKIVRIIQHR
jgi:hypothetical protein